MTLMTGMLPWQHDKLRFTFGAYLNKAKLPKVPRVYGHVRGSPLGGWNMLANDKVGDCVLAGGCHEIMVWAMATSRPIPRFTDDIVLQQYNILTGGKDGGLDPIDTASWRRKIGITDARGVKHQIRAYAAINDLHMLDVAAYVFGAAGVGLYLPDSADDQFERGEVWNDLSGTPTNGHYVPCVGRNSAGNRIVVTWGRLQALTDAYLEKYWAGAVAYFSLEYLKDSGFSPEMINTAQLDGDLAALS